MSNFVMDDIKKIFRKNDPVTQFIFINVGVFILVNLVNNLAKLFEGSKIQLEHYFALPAYLPDFALQFWSLFSYMFLHTGFMHILFNMLWLYWMGRLLTISKGSKVFKYTYILGGLAGGVLYLIVYNLAFMLNLSGDVFNQKSILLGASGGVLAVVFATAASIPDQRMHLLLIGPVKIKHIAIASLLLTTILDFSENTGGKIAHIGGAAFGYFFIKANWYYKFLYAQAKQGQSSGSGSSSFFSRKQKMKVSHKKSVSDDDYNQRKANQQEKVDAILDKISKSGYDSLTKSEKEFLFNIGNNKK